MQPDMPNFTQVSNVHWQGEVQPVHRCVLRGNNGLCGQWRHTRSLCVAHAARSICESKQGLLSCGCCFAQCAQQLACSACFCVLPALGASKQPTVRLCSAAVQYVDPAYTCIWQHSHQAVLLGAAAVHLPPNTAMHALSNCTSHHLSQCWCEAPEHLLWQCHSKQEVWAQHMVYAAGTSNQQCSVLPDGQCCRAWHMSCLAAVLGNLRKTRSLVC